MQFKLKISITKINECKNQKMHGIQMENNEKMHVNEKMHAKRKNARLSNSFIFKAHSFCSGFTVSFSTGSFFFFFRLHFLFLFFLFLGLFSFLGFFLLSTFCTWRHERLSVTRAPYSGSLPNRFWYV